MDEPSPVTPLIREFAKAIGVESLDVAMIFNDWEKLVGPEIAKRCYPMKLSGGVLKVGAESPAWAAQLKYLAPKIASTINDALGKTVVTEVRSSMERGERPARSARSEPKTNDRLPSLPTPSERDVSEAQKMTENIPDERLAEATKKAVLAGKMRKIAGGQRAIIRRNSEGPQTPSKSPRRGPERAS